MAEQLGHRRRDAGTAVPQVIVTRNAVRGIQRRQAFLAAKAPDAAYVLAFRHQKEAGYLLP